MSDSCCQKCECICADCSVGATSDCAYPACLCHCSCDENEMDVACAFHGQDALSTHTGYYKSQPPTDNPTNV